MRDISCLVTRKKRQNPAQPGNPVCGEAAYLSCMALAPANQPNEGGKMPDRTLSEAFVRVRQKEERQSRPAGPPHFWAG
jgi:hypothetical protein